MPSLLLSQRPLARTLNTSTIKNHTTHHTHTAPQAAHPQPFIGLPPPKEIFSSHSAAMIVDNMHAMTTGHNRIIDGKGEASSSSEVCQKNFLLRALKILNWILRAKFKYITETISHCSKSPNPISDNHSIFDESLLYEPCCRKYKSRKDCRIHTPPNNRNPT